MTEESELGLAPVTPVIELAEGPRLSYLFGDLTASYGTMTIATKAGEGLKAFFSRAISGAETPEPVVAVARECAP